jgi:hypothetical protein
MRLGLETAEKRFVLPCPNVLVLWLSVSGKGTIKTHDPASRASALLDEATGGSRLTAVVSTKGLACRFASGRVSRPRPVGEPSTPIPMSPWRPSDRIRLASLASTHPGRSLLAEWSKSFALPARL